MNDKTWIEADPEATQKIYTEIVQYLIKEKPRIVDGLSALVYILVLQSQNAGVTKPNFLAHLSNTWEALDPENEHSIRKAYEESRGPGVKKIYCVRKLDPNFLPSKKPKESDRVED